MVEVYILKSVHFPKTYVGITTDLRRRLLEHNAGQGAYTKRYKPWGILYSEEYGTMIEARKREKYLKSGTGRKFIAEVLSIPR